MTKRECYRAARNIADRDPGWLRRVIDAAEGPADAYMRPLHIRICKLALRHAGRGYQRGEPA